MDGVTGDAAPAVSTGAGSRCSGTAARMPAGSIFAHRPAHRWWYFPDLRADEAFFY